MAKYNSLAELFTATADAIRAKTGGTDPIVAEDFPIAVEGISAGGGAVSVAEKDVNFYDYDGTCLHSYTVEEAQALTELPPLPEQKGLICQGWNWSLEDIKAHNRAVDVGAVYITDDGKTRIYITLTEGRTSPMLGVCPKGTVTVDWGDGTAPDVLTGTSTSTVVWTPNHTYANAGDYVISLTVDGEMSFKGSYNGSYILTHAPSDTLIKAYRNAISKIELGTGITSIDEYAFSNCTCISSVTIPRSVTSLGKCTFSSCNSLYSITIPNSITSLPQQAFDVCYSLKHISIPNGLYSFNDYSIRTVPALRRLVVPNSVGRINSQFCSGCSVLGSIVLPDRITNISSGLFSDCVTLSVIVFPANVTTINTNFCYACRSMRYYDFSKSTVVPTLAATIFGMPDDCEIRVPAALYDEWIVATNWATYARQIVAV